MSDSVRCGAFLEDGKTCDGFFEPSGRGAYRCPRCEDRFEPSAAEAAIRAHDRDILLLDQAGHEDTLYGRSSGLWSITAKRAAHAHQRERLARILAELGS